MPLTNFPFDPNPASSGNETPRVALTIGGSDPTGGAGIQADLKTFQHFGVHGLSVITAVTVQNTSGVHSTNPIPVGLVKEQLYALASDIDIHAIKIGMLATADVVQAVAEFVKLLNVPTVLDPILASSNGISFLDKAAKELLLAELLPLVTIVTPNIPEAESFTRIAISSDEGAVQAALTLHDMGARSVLIKGGHSEGDTSKDLLLDGSADHNTDGSLFEDGFEVDGASIEWLSSPRLDKQVHGTGCVLSSAIASGLAHGLSLRDAVIDAKEFISIMLGDAKPMGSGQEMFDFPPFSLN